MPRPRPSRPPSPSSTGRWRRQGGDDRLLFERVVLFLCGVLSAGLGVLIIWAVSHESAAPLLLFVFATPFLLLGLALWWVAVWGSGKAVETWADMLPGEWVMLAVVVVAMPIYCWLERRHRSK